MAKNIDWIAIKNEYISTNVSYRDLAEKYNISKNQISNKAQEEKWQELRKKQRDKIGTKLGQKTADKIVKAEVDRIENVLKTADKAQKAINIGLGQLNKYIDMFGNIHESEIIDVNKLKKLIAALKDIKDIVKEDNGNDMAKLDAILDKIEGNI